MQLIAMFIFGSVISLYQFKLVSMFLHFTDNCTKSENKGFPELFKI